MTNFNTEYAKQITNADRLSHHLYDCTDQEIAAIKQELYKTPKGAKLFDRATFGSNF